ncbi:hypothetical protein BD779DRAFT_1477103 [Infundibulicybe gibba]|nr:hypothetical protein BD779DRAFT_1477103 [Infundibulicybe gibba]
MPPLPAAPRATVSCSPDQAQALRARKCRHNSYGQEWCSAWTSAATHEIFLMLSLAPTAPSLARELGLVLSRKAPQTLGMSFAAQNGGRTMDETCGRVERCHSYPYSPGLGSARRMGIHAVEHDGKVPSSKLSPPLTAGLSLMHSPPTNDHEKQPENDTQATKNVHTHYPAATSPNHLTLALSFAASIDVTWNNAARQKDMAGEPAVNPCASIVIYKNYYYVYDPL